MGDMPATTASSDDAARMLDTPVREPGFRSPWWRGRASVSTTWRALPPLGRLALAGLLASAMAAVVLGVTITSEIERQLRSPTSLRSRTSSSVRMITGTVTRGAVTTVTFTAERAGAYRIICTTRQPSMNADLTVLPAGRRRDNVCSGRR